MDENKNIIVNLSATRPVNEISIPPNMDMEDYRGMGLTQGQRISLEDRMTCIDQIVKLTSAGYITPEEEQKRISWIQDAQTQEQIDVAFTDLQKSLLELKFSKFTEQHKPVRTGPSKKLLVLPAFMYLVVIFCMIVDVIAGAWWGTSILGAELALTLASYHAFKKQ